MATDPRPALASLVAALERHLEASADRRGENDPVVVAAYQDLADAFEAYDDALMDAYGEVTPLEIYNGPFDEDDDDADDDLDEDDDLDDDVDDTDGVDDNDDMDEEDLDADLDDDDPAAIGVYAGLDADYDDEADDVDSAQGVQMPGTAREDESVPAPGSGGVHVQAADPLER